MFPDGCDEPEMAMFYGFWIYTANWRGRVSNGRCSSRLGFGSLELPKLSKGKYNVRIVNFDKSKTRKSNFTMWTYGLKGEVKIKEIPSPFN